MLGVKNTTPNLKCNRNTISCTNLEENSQVEGNGFSHDRTIRTRTRKEGSSQLIIMLLTVSFAFIILTSPISIRNVIYALGFFSTDSNRQHAQAALVIAISSRLMLVNAAINFWLYSITGHKFRQDVKNTLFKCFWRFWERAFPLPVFRWRSVESGFRLLSLFAWMRYKYIYFNFNFGGFSIFGIWPFCPTAELSDII